MSDSSSDTTASATESMPVRNQSRAAGAILWLILFAALGYAAYYLYQQQQRVQSQLQQLQEAQQQAANEGASRTQKNQQDLETIRLQHQEMVKNFTALLDQNQTSKEEWRIFEAEHLVKVANQQLSFQHDIGTAVKALQAADDRLKNSSDLGVIAIRKALAEDMRTLRAIPQADIVGISLAISALSQDIDKLPLQTPDPKSREQQNPPEKAPSNSAEAVKWSDLPLAIWQDLKSLVVIRNHEEPVKALLAPEQRFFLTENLRLQLEQARLAMLAGEAAVYKERIDTAQKWTQRYFDTKVKSTQAALATLKNLHSENVAPTLPETSRAYQALQRYQQQKSKKD